MRNELGAESRSGLNLDHFARAYRCGETGVERMTVDLIRKPDLWADMGWPEISKIERQVRIGRSVADIVVHHADRSITIIEVKVAGLSLRDYCTGIGQLAYQSVMAMSDFQTFSVRRVLAMPGQFPVDVAIVCMAQNVGMLPMPSIDQWMGFIEEALAA